MAKGRKTGGRTKGTPNRTTTAAKEAIALAFQGIGGVPTLQQWAAENPTEFFTRIWVKLLPQEMEHAGKNGGPIQTESLTPEQREARVLSLVAAAKKRARSA